MHSIRHKWHKIRMKLTNCYCRCDYNDPCCAVNALERVDDASRHIHAYVLASK